MNKNTKNAKDRFGGVIWDIRAIYYLRKANVTTEPGILVLLAQSQIWENIQF